MSNYRHEDETNDFEVEITDLDTAYEGNRTVDMWLFLQRLYSKVQSKQMLSSALRVTVLIIVFLLPMASSYSGRIKDVPTGTPLATECRMIHFFTVDKATDTPAVSYFVVSGILSKDDMATGKTFKVCNSPSQKSNILYP